MICKNCGFEFSKGIFCPKCGTKNELAISDEKAKVSMEAIHEEAIKRAQEDAEEKISAEKEQIKADVERKAREDAVAAAMENAEKKAQEEIENKKAEIEREAQARIKEEAIQKVKAEAEKEAQAAEDARRKQEHEAEKSHRIALILAILAWVLCLTTVGAYIFGGISISVAKKYERSTGKKLKGIIISDIVCMISISALVILGIVLSLIG